MTKARLIRKIASKMKTDEIGRGQLVDQVAERLREKIFAGEYPPGARLRQEQLSRELEISRTPLREALRLLERDGLVVVTPKRGVRVITVDHARLLEAYELREVLDGLAARLAAQRGGRDLHVQLRRQLELQEMALHPFNARLWTRLNVAFHMLIVEYANNGLLLRQQSLIRLTGQVFYPELLLEPARAAQACEEHRIIAAVISAGDENGAEQAARTHVRRTMAQLRATPLPGEDGAGKEEQQRSPLSRRGLRSIKAEG